MPRDGIRWKTGQGPTNFARKLLKLESAVEARIQRAMGEAALLIERRAKEYAPVGETGNLRASIAHVVNRMGRDTVKAVIGSNVEYAPYQEFGTYKMAAQPFLRPALENSRDEIEDIFATAYREAVRAA